MKHIYIIFFSNIFIIQSCLTNNQFNNISNEKIKIACIGDSITFGSGIKNRDINSYPAKLQNKLGDRYFVANFGVNGATLLKKGNKPYWKRKVFEDAKNFNPDIAIIKLGTNDSKSKNWKYRDEFKENYVELITLLRTINPFMDIYLCYPTPSFPGIYGIRNSVIKNEIIPVINSIDKNVTVIDLHTPFLNKRDFFPDKVHPNKYGAEAISNIVYPYIIQNR